MQHQIPAHWGQVSASSTSKQVSTQAFQFLEQIFLPILKDTRVKVAVLGELVDVELQPTNNNKALILNMHISASLVFEICRQAQDRGIRVYEYIGREVRRIV